MGNRAARGAPQPSLAHSPACTRARARASRASYLAWASHSLPHVPGPGRGRRARRFAMRSPGCNPPSSALGGLQSRSLQHAPPSGKSWMDRAALYRAALQATGHPEITPDRIVRLVDQVASDFIVDCRSCGSVCGGWHEWTDEEPNYYDDIPPDCLCACGSLQSKANFYRADLCASCGADPRKSEPPLCGRCGEPEPKWRDGRYHPELHPYDRDHPELPYDDYQLSTIAMLVSGEVPCSACRSRDAPLEYTEKATLWSTRRDR